MRLAVLAVAAVVVRLPFLLRADRFFDSDEAVEGLMARHLGDHSLFLWGQGYKGTPEVFLTSAVFRMTGPSVVALKAVTLTVFVAFVLLNFVLVERLFSRRIAWIATTILIVAPPSLVFWSLSGCAEIAMTLLAGGVLLLAVEKKKPLVACAAVGFGLWVHQYIVYYVVALAITTAALHREWLTRVRADVLARVPAWVGVVLQGLAAVAILYALLGVLAFFTGGIDLEIAGVHATATHPQKLWWIAGVLMAVVGVLSAAILGIPIVPRALAFLAGYFPAILGSAGRHGVGAPIAHMNFGEFAAVLPDITGVMTPMLLGFRDPSGVPTPVASLVLVVVALVALSYWDVCRRRLPAFFHVLLIVAPLMFLVSGSYQDPQSYRYLMPMYAALPIVYAIGIDSAWRKSGIAGTVLTLLLVGMFGAEQVAWYNRLQPDTESERAIACMNRAGIHLARARYRQSYKITFLTDERIIVAPVDGLDRYATYTQRARVAPLLEATAACE